MVILVRARLYGWLVVFVSSTQDESNNHQPAELNFWVPLNKVFGANTLYTESSPGAGDFAAVELEYGQAVRFWGNRCRHYAVPNTTDTTRVSEPR